MKLGIIIFIIPFFFVMEPALVFQASIRDVLYNVLSAAIGVFALGGSLEGYVQGVGRIRLVFRISGFLGALLMIVPGWRTDSIGLGIIIISMIGGWLTKKKIVEETAI